LIYSTLLQVLANRSNYYKYKEYIVKPHILPSEIQDIAETMEVYYSKHISVKDIEWDEFITWYKFSKMSSISKDKHDIYNSIFLSLESHTPTTIEIDNTLEFLLEKDSCIKIADHLIKVSEGDDTKSILDAEGMIEEFKRSSKAVSSEEMFSTTDFDDLLDTTGGEGLEWRLGELNQSLGPLRGGDFINVTSRPDSGKTTMLCSEATHMAAQLPEGKCVFWANNEEAIKKVKMRVIQAALGMKRFEVLGLNSLDLQAELSLALNGKFNDRFSFYHNNMMKVSDIERRLDVCNPGLIIFDQLWKVMGFPEAFSETDKLTKLFGWARYLADKYECPVINVHQASGDAAGVAYIEAHQMYSSKTGIQGEVDAILGIGRVTDPAVHMNTRFLNISKNKLDGGVHTLPEKRNGKYEVSIEPEIARFKSYL
jgi:replicative DNA helicase